MSPTGTPMLMRISGEVGFSFVMVAIVFEPA
jgi:hypothetical protein